MKVCPVLFDHSNSTSFEVSKTETLFLIFHTVSAFGVSNAASWFFIHPKVTSYPLKVSKGWRSLMFSDSSSCVSLYYFKTISSILRPFKFIDPEILWVLILTLWSLLRASLKSIVFALSMPSDSSISAIAALAPTTTVTLPSQVEVCRFLTCFAHC